MELVAWNFDKTQKIVLLCPNMTTEDLIYQKEYPGFLGRCRRTGRKIVRGKELLSK
jgi:hypothetical protein